MLLPHMTLVVSPLLSLMKDQIDFLQERGIPAARLDSTLERDEFNDVLDRARSGELKILMISVERFKSERFRSQLQRMKISLMVVDEAHCVSEWGHNFRPEYLKLPVYKKDFGIGQVLLLTATATPRVIADMCRAFDVPRKSVVITGFYRENLYLQVTPTPESRKNEALLRRVKESPRTPTIVYVTLQKTAENVADLLIADGILAHPYHAGLATADREEIQNRYMAGELRCIVATIAFGMGIDKRDIRRIIHYDLPKSIEGYSQEIGRSGRDGNEALCEVLANRDNINVLENFVYGDTPERTSIGKLLREIKDYGGVEWEVSGLALSNELDIRLLPLKTLLVYLDMEGIIKPTYTYFKNYSYKEMREPREIVEDFHGERRQFIEALFERTTKKKTWTIVDVQGIIQSYPTKRERVVAALDYFNEKGWIELSAKQSTEVYKIMNQSFDVEELTEKFFTLFKKKEENEVQRIHNMVAFFESDACLSRKLARYFGESIEKRRCGHCSVCGNEVATLEQTTELTPLTSYDYDELTEGFVKEMGAQLSRRNLTRFLCGINSPFFAKKKLRKEKHFGVLDRYRFMDVREWIDANMTS